VHRDVKPAHVLLTRDLCPVLGGFGLAQLREQAASPEVVGTPAYMAPEAAEGRQGDGRADIYSLGGILYEMLCGRRPFAASIIWERLRQAREEEPPAPRKLNPNIPRDLEAICLKAMAKRVTDRYTTASDLRRDICEWLRAEGKPVGDLELTVGLPTLG